MRGYPKFLGTKADYLYVIKNFPKSAWQQDVENLLATKQDWFFVRSLESADAGVTDATHKVLVEEGMDSDAAPTFSQYELRDNPNARMFQLGITEAEIKTWLEM